MPATAKRKAPRPGREPTRDSGTWIKGKHREALRPPSAQTVSQWAEANRVLGPESSIPGPWRNRVVPYLVGPMDDFTRPDVEKIILCFAAQSAKTEFELNCLGYIVDQNPGTTMIAYDSERQADKVMRRRIHPMLLQSPALRRHLSGNSDELGLKEVTLDRCFIFTAWSNSPGALASNPCCYVILDEVDKFPPFAGREANPIELATLRTRTFRGRRKILVVSTPTLDSGYVWSEFLRSNQNRRYVPCVHCGHFQMLAFDFLKWEKKVSPQEVSENGLAWYECTSCHEKILEKDRYALDAHGVWVPKGMTISSQGELEGKQPSRLRSGYQLSVLYSPFVTFGEIAAKWIDSLGDHGRMMDFFNGWLGLPWQERIESITEARVKGSRRDYAAGVVPKEAQLLTAGVDVQADCFWYSIRAWGLQERSWLIRYGVVQTWDQVWKVISAAYPIEGDGGRRLAVQRVLIDSGFHTKQVYEFCQKHRPLTWPSKGSNNPALVVSCRQSRPEPGIVLFTFRADHYKDKLATLIGMKPGEPGEWMTHQEVEEDPYVKHMTAERRVIVRQNGRRYSTWRPLTESTPNHLFDTEVLNVLTAEQLGVRYLSLEPAPNPSAAPTQEGREEAWIERDPDWLSDGGDLE
jgi:phage terminase large subunit GpA-like protein